MNRQQPGPGRNPLNNAGGTPTTGRTRCRNADQLPLRPGPVGTQGREPTTSTRPTTLPPAAYREEGTVGGRAEGATGGAQDTPNTVSIHKCCSRDVNGPFTHSELLALWDIVYDRMTELGLVHECAFNYVTGINAKQAIKGVKLPNTLEEAHQMIAEGPVARKERAILLKEQAQLRAQLAVIRPRLQAAHIHLHDVRRQPERREIMQQEINRLEAEHQQAAGRLAEIGREMARIEINRRGVADLTQEEVQNDVTLRRGTTGDQDTATRPTTSNATQLILQRSARNRARERQRSGIDRTLGQEEQEHQETMEREETRPKQGMTEAECNRHNQIMVRDVMPAQDEQIRQLLRESEEAKQELQTADQRNLYLLQQNQQLREERQRFIDGAFTNDRRMQETIDGLEEEVQQIRATKAEEIAQRTDAREIARKDEEIAQLHATIRELQETRDDFPPESENSEEQNNLADINQTLQNQLAIAECRHANDIATLYMFGQRIVQLQQRITTEQQEHEGTRDDLFNLQRRFDRVTLHRRQGTCPHFMCRECADQGNAESAMDQVERTWPTGGNPHHPDNDVSDEEMDYGN